MSRNKYFKDSVRRGAVRTYDDSFLQKRGHLINSSVFRDYVLQEFLERERVREAFHSDLSHCPKIKVSMPNALDGDHIWTGCVLLTKGLPILTGWLDQGAVAASPDDPDTIYYSVDWTFVTEVNVPYVTSVWATVNKYVMENFYLVNQHYDGVRSGSLGPGVINNSYLKYTSKALFDIFLPHWMAAHGKKDKGGLAAGVDYNSAWSESNWPEMRGLATIYVDNVGVFAPDFLEVDKNLSQDLSNQYVGCYFSRIPSSQIEAWLWYLKAGASIAVTLMGGNVGAQNQGQAGFTSNYDYGTGASGSQFIPYTGDAAQGQGASQAASGALAGGRAAINLQMDILSKYISNLRTIIPRIRTFGRQQGSEFPIQMNYDKYRQDISRLGPIQRYTLMLAVANHYGLDQQSAEYIDYFQKKIVVLSREAYNKFIQDLLPYANISNWGSF